MDEEQVPRVEAYGIDRALPDRGDYLFPMSWFDIPFKDLTIDLTVSHLAFSSPLLYQHRVEGDELEAYVQRYHQILEALRVGGAFAYAPALPFMEDRLSDDRFRVERWRVAAGFGAARVTRVRL